MFLQGWVNGILINESSVYGTLCIVLLKILNMGLYFSEIDTRGWPYRRQDLLLPFSHSFAENLPITIFLYQYPHFNYNVKWCQYSTRALTILLLMNMLFLSSNFQHQTALIWVNALILHVLLMLCLPKCHCIKVWLLCNSWNTCKAHADVIDNTSQQPFMLKCFVNFILAEHEFKIVFKLMSIEIAFV